MRMLWCGYWFTIRSSTMAIYCYKKTKAVLITTIVANDTFNSTLNLPDVWKHRPTFLSKAARMFLSNTYKISSSTRSMYSLNDWIKNLCNRFNIWSNYFLKSRQFIFELLGKLISNTRPNFIFLGNLTSHKCPKLFKKMGGVFKHHPVNWEWKHSMPQK